MEELNSGQQAAASSDEWAVQFVYRDFIIEELVEFLKSKRGEAAVQDSQHTVCC